MAADKRKGRGGPSQITRDIRGIGLAALSLILILGFATKNIGLAGNALINVIEEFTGYLGYLMPLFFLWWALSEFLHRTLPFKYTFFWGLLALTGGGSTFLHLTAPGPSGAPGGGGLLGDFLADGFLRIAFGTAGAYIISGALIAVAVVLLADISVKSFLNELRASILVFAGKVFKGIKSFFSSSSAGLKKEPEPAAVKKKKKKKSSALKEDKKEEKALSPNIEDSGAKKNITPAELKEPARYSVPASLLNEPRYREGNREEEEDRGRELKEVLRNFSIEAEISAIESGPSITRYEIEIPPGIKLSRIRNLSSNIAMALKAKTVRLLTPIPGKSAVGVEVPSIEQETVYIKSMITSPEYKKSSAALPYCIGKSVSGENIVADLAKMPHLLLAGATGSGKSAAIHSLISSMLFKESPGKLRFILIDPKRVELPVYRDIPHLHGEVICDCKKAVSILSTLTLEMDNRYDKLARHNVSSIEAYNSLKETEKPMPRLVIVIDELADLMALSREKVEHNIVRIAQMARAVGIHLVLATQRPSVDVITGLIKANLPARIAFNVLSGVDSRTILDSTGAEKLLGKGDLLYLPPDLPQPLRIQGSFIRRKEVERVVKFIKENYLKPEGKLKLEKEKKSSDNSSYEDELFPDAVRVIIQNRKASISLIQRKLRIGYNRAARIIDTMEANNIISPEEGTKARQVLVGREYLDNLNEN